MRSARTTPSPRYSAISPRVPSRACACSRSLPSAVAILAENANLPREGGDQLYSATGGNPFFVTEVLASTSPGVPVSVRDAVLARAARHSPAGRAALDLASVVPRRIEQGIVDSIAGADLIGFDVCAASGMLRQDDDAYAFRHELARLAVKSALSASRRRSLHAHVLQ